MSYYRDDREAACRRIEALEAKLREREEELAAQGADLSAREEENARLREEVEQARGLSPRRGLVSVTTVWAARSVGVALLMCSAMGGAGFFMSSQPRSSLDPGAFEVERRQMLVEQRLAEQRARAAELDPFEDPPPAAAAPAAPSDPSKELDEYALRRSLEPKVWSGRASVEEIRLLRVLCSHQGDMECRVRAASMLPDRRSP